MITRKRFWSTTILAWIVFIGIDFLFHASLLEGLWQEDIESFKSTKDLFLLIPAGYGSFFLLTLLVGYVFTSIYPRKPTTRKVVKFSMIFGSLYCISFLLSLFSFVDIPLKHLIAFSFVYFIEINAVIFIFYKASFQRKINRLALYSILAFFVLIIMGIVVQNLI